MPTYPRLPQKPRRYSWPPLKLIIPRNKKDIDEDPFSYFISPANDHHTQVAKAHMEADIEQRPRPRSLSPYTIQNRDKVLQSPAIRRLKRWIQRMEVRYLHRRTMDQITEELSLPTPPNSPTQLQVSGIKQLVPTERDTEPIFDIFDITVSPPLRGRRPTRSNRRRYGDKAVRGHSQRARVWKAPDEDIWPVPEEQEDVGLGIKL